MRLSSLITALLAAALLVGVLPAAGAQTRETPGTAPPATVSWEPGQVDVDWAAFAAAHREEYEGSRWASAAAELADESAEDVREQARELYHGSTDGGDASFSTLEPQRSGALGQQYYDECDDGTNLPQNGLQAVRRTLFRGGADGILPVTYNPPNPDGGLDPPPLIDLRSTFIVQSTDDQGRFDQTAFLVYACQQWTKDALGAGGITFGLYVGADGETEYPTLLGDPEEGPDYIVTFFPENNVPERPLQVMAIRTPTRDTDTWFVTFLDEAERLDNYEIDGVVPTSAIGDFTADSGFAWTVEAVDTQQPYGGRDWFPERTYLLRVGEGDDAIEGTHIPQFPVPDGCGTQVESEVRYTLEPMAVTPNDDGYPVQWYHPQIRTPQAWDTIRDSSTGGRDRPVTIAVVDSGIDSTRFDFLASGARVVGGYDAVYGLELEGGDAGGALGPFIGPSAIGYQTFGATAPPRNSDRGPHGTAVASLIGAEGNNVIGLAGVDWGARLMPIRVNDVNECIDNVVVAEGIKWAVDHGADIVHVSLGSPEAAQGEGSDIQPECNDGEDNDGDGLVDDGEDPGCLNPQDGSEGPRPADEPFVGEQAAACSDRRDNDGDGAIDLADENCDDASDNEEADRTGLTRPAEPFECDDGVDNDGDGFIDAEDTAVTAADPGCEAAEDGSEGPSLADAAAIPEDATACGDGRDNNDRDEVADINDPQCDSAADNNEGEEATEVDVDPLREVIDYALEQGVPVVAAAGNFGADADPVVYPAAYSGVLTVGASDRSGGRAFYSSTGRWLDLIAPGGNNSGSLRQDVAVLWELDRIRSAAGSSFAAPLVTGAASLYLGLNPHITRGFTPSPLPPDPGANLPDTGYQRTVDDVKIALQNGVRDLFPEGHDIFHGWGRLDVDRALDVPAVGGPLIDPARVQLPRTNADSVIEAAEGVALSRPTVLPAFVVLTRSDVPVDALAAAPLLGEAPLLVANPDGIAASTLATINELMPDGGRVYVLGGEAALGTAVDDQLAAAGHEVVRLSGPTRVDTAIAVAEEARRLYPGSTTVALSRSDGDDNPTAQWADALSGGAWAAATRTPLLVTPTDQLHPAVADALDRWGTTETVLFGGTGALSAAVAAAVPSPRRVGGADRADTAARVATELWNDADGYMLVNGYFARGWPAAMAAAGWAADRGAPLLYTGYDNVPPATAAVLGESCPEPDDLQIVGGASLVTGTAETALLEAATCQ